MLVFAATALWSIATPLFAAPDEPVHIVKAAAVVRGELLGNLADGPASPFGLVRVPEYYALLRWPGSNAAHSRICFHSHPSLPASCVIAADSGPSAAAALAGATRQAWIYNARYPPLYYAIVGLPTLFGQGNGALYAMRLVSAFLSALFIALAVSCVHRYSRAHLVYLGLMLATTPMVLFLGAVVNPSGFEIAVGICLWTSAAVLVTEHLAAPPRALLALVGLSASIFVLIRSLSPLWLALIAVLLLALADRSALRRALARSDVRLVLGVIAIVSSAALVWIVKEHATDVYSGAQQLISQVPKGTSNATILSTAFLRNSFYFPDMIGVFGWFDTWAPAFTYLVWYFLVGLASLAGALFGGFRRAAVLFSLLVLLVVVPTLASASQARQHGYIWSGRDALPLAVGLPILASACCAPVLSRRLSLSTARGHLRWRRLFGAAVVLTMLSQFGAFYEALRRYSVGTKGPVFSFIAHPSWRPPLGVPLLLAAELLVLVGGAIVLMWSQDLSLGARLLRRRRRAASGAAERSGPEGQVLRPQTVSELA